MATIERAGDLHLWHAMSVAGNVSLDCILFPRNLFGFLLDAIFILSAGFFDSLDPLNSLAIEIITCVTLDSFDWQERPQPSKSSELNSEEDRSTRSAARHQTAEV